jgi:hypothetical protein
MNMAAAKYASGSRPISKEQYDGNMQASVHIACKGEFFIQASNLLDVVLVLFDRHKALMLFDRHKAVDQDPAFEVTSSSSTVPEQEVWPLHDQHYSKPHRPPQ